MSMFEEKNFGGFLSAKNYGYNFESSTKKVYEMARKNMNMEDAATMTQRFALKRGFQLLEKVITDEKLDHNEKIEISYAISERLFDAMFKDINEYEDDMNEILAKKIREYANIIAISHRKIKSKQ